MINHTVVNTFSKLQTTVESSTYGSELVAARNSTDMAVETLYTLQMLGVSIDGSIFLLGDNKSVVLNTTIPSSPLKKKHNAIAYHCVREAIAAWIICFCHIDTNVKWMNPILFPILLTMRPFINLYLTFVFPRKNGKQTNWTGILMLLLLLHHGYVPFFYRFVIVHQDCIVQVSACASNMLLLLFDEQFEPKTPCYQYVVFSPTCNVISTEQAVQRTSLECILHSSQST